RLRHRVRFADGPRAQEPGAARVRRHRQPGRGDAVEHRSGDRPGAGAGAARRVAAGRVRTRAHSVSPDALLRAVETYGVRISVRGDNLVLAGLVEELPVSLIEEVRERKTEVLRHLADRAGDLPVARSAGARSYRASFGQARLAYLHQLQPRSAAYNIAASVRFRGPCDVQLLKTSLTWLVDRHPALRTSLASIPGRFVATVAESVAVDLPMLDLTTASPTDVETEVAALRRSMSTTSFDLTVPPLWRCMLVRRGPEDIEVIAG